VEALLAGVSEASCRARFAALSAPAPSSAPQAQAQAMAAAAQRAPPPAPAPPAPAPTANSLLGRIAAHTARTEEAARGAAAARMMEGLQGRLATAAAAAAHSGGGGGGGGGAGLAAVPVPGAPVKPLSSLVQDDFSLAGFKQPPAPANLPSMGARGGGGGGGDDDSEGEAPLSKEQLRATAASAPQQAWHTDVEQLE
jgi:hypothetical protein